MSGGIFDLDNKFNRALTKIVDCVLLSILWMVSSIPIVTIGASTTALYYAVHKVILHNRGYVWRDYWAAFRSNFKKSTIAWIIMLVVAAIFGIDINIMRQFSELGEKIGSIYTVFYVFLAVELVWANYVFSYMARFEDKLGRIFRNTVVIMLMNLIWSLLVLIMFAVACYVVYIFPPAILIIPSAYMICLDDTVERVYVKYMTPEQLEEEKERNMDDNK